MKTSVDTWLALILIGAAVSKAWRPGTAAAFATYGLRRRRLQRLARWLLVVIELSLGVALLTDAAWGSSATVCLFGLFSLAASAALLRGQRGRPCACFGGQSRLSWWTPLYSLGLGVPAGTVALGWLPDAPAGYERWLTISLAVCLAAAVALGLVVLALAREVGVLRLGIASQGALEIPDEGPAVGTMQPWAAMLPWQRSTLLGLAIFTSEGCPLCRQLVPTFSHVAADPLLAVQRFDEVADAEVWRQAAVPGSPYAVAVDADGVVRAKGTFNSLPQLESIIGTARTRHQEVAVVA